MGALFSVPTSPPLSTGANVAPTLLRTCVSSQRPPQRTGSPPGPPSSSSLCTVMDTRHHASHVVHIAPGDGHRGVAQGYLGSALSSPCRSSMDRTTCDATAPGAADDNCAAPATGNCRPDLLGQEYVRAPASSCESAPLLARAPMPLYPLRAHSISSCSRRYLLQTGEPYPDRTPFASD